MNGASHVDCPTGQVLIERTEAMQRMIEKHDTEIDGIRNRLPNWAVAVISLLMAMCGWFAARGG